MTRGGHRAPQSHHGTPERIAFDLDLDVDSNAWREAKIDTENADEPENESEPEQCLSPPIAGCL